MNRPPITTIDKGTTSIFYKDINLTISDFLLVEGPERCDLLHRTTTLEARKILRGVWEVR